MSHHRGLNQQRTHFLVGWRWLAPPQETEHAQPPVRASIPFLSRRRQRCHPPYRHLVATSWLSRLIAGEDEWPLLVAAADELEKEIGAGLVDGQAANLVDDQEPRRRVELELVLEPTLGKRLGE